MYRQLDISSDWRITFLEPDEGLLPKHLAYAPMFDPKDAVRADMPATAPTAYFDAGRIPDPYFGRNNLDTLWMEKKEWWYLKDFDLPRLDGTYRLTFEGVNYRAEAWLNGVQIAVWEGTFLKKSIDLDNTILKRKGNRLTVRVRLQERAWEDGEEVTPRGYQNSTAHIRTQRPTPQFAHGWNWSPHMIAPGIWRPVRLEWMGAGRFEDGRVSTKLAKDHQTGRVQFGGLVRNLSGEDRVFDVALRVTGKAGQKLERRCEVKVKPGAVRRVKLEVNVPKPRLWWPNGHGEQALYKVEATLLSGGRTCDRHARKQGFRRIRFLRNRNDVKVLEQSGQTNRMWSVAGKPYPWTLEVNGKRIFAKGSNWCPVDNLYRPRERHVRRLVELARDAHYVMLRVWGGGLTESDHFYDVCDELGLVCIQEFWLACGSYPAMDYDTYLESAHSEIARLRERTCLAFWGGGNEFNPDSLENKPLIDALAKAIADVDGTREFRRGSPYRGDRHGGLVSTPLWTTNKYRDLLPGKKRIVLLRSECAVGRSPARPENIRKFIPKDALWPVNWREYQNHHAQRLEWKQVTQPFGSRKEWEQDLLHASVMHCIDSRYNMEYARLGKYECSGCLTWQLNASWPSFHREHVDWYGAPKPVYYWYKHACKPLIACADFERFVFHPGERLDTKLLVVSDLDQATKASLRIRVLSIGGEVLYERVKELNVPADTARPAGKLSWRIPECLAGSAFYLDLELKGESQPTYRNTYWLAVSPDTHFHTGMPIGEGLTLEYQGHRFKVDAPHYYSRMEIVDEETELAAAGSTSRVRSYDATYEARFQVPPKLRGKPLELFLPGISADDVVSLNGKEIGRTKIDPRREPSYLADPLRWPLLPVRFYDIPESILRRGNNTVRIDVRGERLKKTTDRLFGLTEMIHLRERTPEDERRRIRKYLREMKFFTPITRGEQAQLRVDVRRRSSRTFTLRLINPGKVPAAFIVLDLQDEGPVQFTFDEGAISSLPGGERSTATLKIDGVLPKKARLTVMALNLAPVRVKLP